MWSRSTRVKNLKMTISPHCRDKLTLKASSSPAKSPSVSEIGKRKKSNASLPAQRSTTIPPKRSSKSAPPASSSSLPFSTSLVSSDTCANCGKAGVRLREVTRSFKVDGTLMLIERIPQISCPHCGESYFTAQTMHEIERIKRLRKSLAVKTTVPIATFLAAA
jgi:YgiT-type zinc finger domain-containing protein